MTAQTLKPISDLPHYPFDPNLIEFNHEPHKHQQFMLDPSLGTLASIYALDPRLVDGFTLTEPSRQTPNKA